ncbi:MAG: arginine--tRNA ligase [Bacteroidia bacterium]|nr:arginine--tRNA ligase [Bacteroidia bacterium]
MDIIGQIQEAAAKAIQELYQVEVEPTSFPIQETKKEFEGDFTLVTFALTRLRIGAPPVIAEALGKYFLENVPMVESYNVVKGFLNLVISAETWREYLAFVLDNKNFFTNSHGEDQTVVVEYCSPNTNKPLHLGHLRNIILGYSLTQILEANGYKAIPTCLFNDRGTNISKSMWAYLEEGKLDTPEEAGVKGDKLVGDYYVKYARAHKAALEAVMEEKSLPKHEAEKLTPTIQAINEMTVKWEEGDKETRALWEKMNNWVYKAYEDTFARLGVSFNKFYYESKVYLRGKETVEEGLEKGIFYKDDEGTVWVDLTDDGLDKKVLLRSNGTSLYITQDLAIAADKFVDYKMNKSVYVVGNEQDYHFKVLFKILEKLGKPYAEGLFHLSYGMVNLPSGKMKSREGTTVEADDLMDTMVESAREVTELLGKTEGMDERALKDLYEKIGLAALKYFLVKVDPKKTMLFDPQESIQLHGTTGPSIQYSYTRTMGVKRKANAEKLSFSYSSEDQTEEEMLDSERSLLKYFMKYKDVLRESGESYNPSLLANYCYDLSKEYNRFFHDGKILQSDKPHTSAFRFALSDMVGKTLKEGMKLLGIEMLDRM